MLEHLLRMIIKKSTLNELNLNLKCTKINDKGFQKLTDALKKHMPELQKFELQTS